MSEDDNLEERALSCKTAIFGAVGVFLFACLVVLLLLLFVGDGGERNYNIPGLAYNITGPFNATGGYPPP